MSMYRIRVTVLPKQPHEGMRKQRRNETKVAAAAAASMKP
jgi:hypothetical protein